MDFIFRNRRKEMISADLLWKLIFRKRLRDPTSRNLRRKMEDRGSLISLFKNIISYLKNGNMIWFLKYGMEKILQILLIQTFGKDLEKLNKNKICS